jgi:hypothetical protein
MLNSGFDSRLRAETLHFGVQARFTLYKLTTHQFPPKANEPSAQTT